MREFSSFAISFCGVCVATGGIYMLIPEGRMTKTVKYIIVLTLISAFIGVFSVNLSINFQNRSNKSQYAESERGEKIMGAVFEQALKMNDIEFEKIVIFTDKTEEGSITITKIQVFTNENREKVVSAIGNGNAYDIEIVS
ncbi:MAG TPA: hypothetical protein DEW35_03475 [Ruminococcaceae bacterium]|nr:hypothetical protein [Oscillospiraceae bacterium]